VVFALLLWYNHARFGSIFEFGHRYQLTGPALPADYQDITSPNYIIPNAYTYLFRPPVLTAEFPYLTVPWIKQAMWPFFIRIPEHYYYTEPTAGILLVVPLVGFTVLFFAGLLWLFVNGDLPSGRVSSGASPEISSWLSRTLGVYVFIQTLVLLVFISSAIRYLFDITPAALVLCVLLVGNNIHRLVSRPFAFRALIAVWTLASILTVLGGALIGITGDRNLFLNQNPQLYYQLREWLP
jgi:hypothetical protein